MRRFEQQEIQGLDKRYRTHLINSLSGFKSVNLVGTVNGKKQTNLAIISSVVHLGADPALMGFIMRPVTVTRDTYNNILETRHFTLNHITADFFTQAHQTSARYPADRSEFEETGLTAEFKHPFPAPYVAESPVQIGLEFLQKMEIELNGTLLIIGAIRELYVPENCLGEDGFVDIQKAGTITVSGLDSYHNTGKLARLSYAKVDREVKVIG